MDFNAVTCSYSLTLPATHTLSLYAALWFICKHTVCICCILHPSKTLLETDKFAATLHHCCLSGVNKEFSVSPALFVNSHYCANNGVALIYRRSPVELALKLTTRGQ